MAVSKIENPNITQVAVSNLTGYKVGTSTVAKVADKIVNTALKIAELNFSMATGGELVTSSNYAIASMAPKPYATIKCDVNRADGGNAVGTLTISTNGDISMAPLVSIPSGVYLRACVTYFYQ